MHRLLSALAVVTLAATIPLTANAATKMGHVTFRSPLHTMEFRKVIATATLTYKKQDTAIAFHASRLPSPSVLHKKVYVLWATDGGMKDKVGSIMIEKNGTATLMGSVMMTKITDLVVKAAKSASSTAKGETVLSGMVGM